jgi:hypothetical protein
VLFRHVIALAFLGRHVAARLFSSFHSALKHHTTAMPIMTEQPLTALQRVISRFFNEHLESAPMYESVAVSDVFSIFTQQFVARLRDVEERAEGLLLAKSVNAFNDSFRGVLRNVRRAHWQIRGEVCHFYVGVRVRPTIFKRQMVLQCNDTDDESTVTIVEHRKKPRTMITPPPTSSLTLEEPLSAASSSSSLSSLSGAAAAAVTVPASALNTILPKPASPTKVLPLEKRWWHPSKRQTLATAVVVDNNQMVQSLMTLLPSPPGSPIRMVSDPKDIFSIGQLVMPELTSFFSDTGYDSPILG